VKRPFLHTFAIAAVALGALVGLSACDRSENARSGQAAVGGPFQLVDQNGKPRDESALKGKWSAVFFGFTFCPEACPTTLLALGQAQDLLGPRGESLQAVFISVDPERDTPQAVRAYLDNPVFPQGSIGLTGKAPQVDAAARAYHVFYQKEGEGPDYTVNHTTLTYLMNPKGRFACVLPYGLTPEQLADRIGKAMRSGPDARNC
jgi:protein SCO1/2